MGDFCNNCNKSISNFSVGAEFKYVALDGKAGWDIYRISLQIENLCSGLPFAHTNEAWEEAGGTSAVSLFFPYIAHKVPHRPEICFAEGQRSLKMHFLPALWLVGSGRNRCLYQEWHDTRQPPSRELTSFGHSSSVALCIAIAVEKSRRSHFLYSYQQIKLKLQKCSDR